MNGTRRGDNSRDCTSLLGWWLCALRLGCGYNILLSGRVTDSRTLMTRSWRKGNAICDSEENGLCESVYCENRIGWWWGFAYLILDHVKQAALCIFDVFDVMDTISNCVYRR